MRSAVAALRGYSHPAAALTSLSRLFIVAAAPADASTAQGLRSITYSSSAHHSSPHTHQPERDVQQLQQQLLQNALKHVNQHGWTRASLAAAAADLQLSPAAVGMFPRGPSQLVEHFIAQQNAQLEQELQEQQQQYLALPLRQRIAAAVRRRLEMNAAHMDSWPQALALVSQPPNAPAALRLLTQLLDTIWYAAGDTATDSSWYTKRAALASVYLSTELYMLTDYSPGYADTWQQLERRIDDVLWLGSAAQSVSQGAAALLQVLSAHWQQGGAGTGQQQQQHTQAADSGTSSSGPSAIS